MLPIALGAAAILLAIASLLALAASRARAKTLAEDVRTRIEPYLRRKAAEAEVAADAPIWTSRSMPEEIVDYSARLASGLLDIDRSGPPPTPSQLIALENTQPTGDAATVMADMQRRG